MHKCTQHRLTGKERKCLKRRKGSMSSIRGVSHFTRRTKRRLYFKLQLWMWRKRQKKCSFALFRAKKQACCSSSRLSVKTQKRQKVCQFSCPSSSFLHMVPEENACAPAAKTEGSAGVGERIELSWNVHPRLNTDYNACGLTTPVKETRTLELSESTVHPPSNQTDPDVEMLTEDIHGRYSLNTCKENKSQISAYYSRLKWQYFHISVEFLDNFYRMYGSFIPLQKTDVLKHLKRKFDIDFSNRFVGRTIVFWWNISSNLIVFNSPQLAEKIPSSRRLTDTEQRSWNRCPPFRWSTRNTRWRWTTCARWLTRTGSMIRWTQSSHPSQNVCDSADVIVLFILLQVMNMYGELIMDSANHKVTSSAK